MQAELLKGSRGVFDVRLDGDLLFSKLDEGRFPAPSEIIDTLRERLPA